MNKKGSPGNGNYVVGKGRRPPSTRWKSGQSGNPKGRPKGVKNMITYFQEALSRKIDVKVGGKIRAMSTREGIAMNTTNLALKGNVKDDTFSPSYRTRIQRGPDAQKDPDDHRQYDPEGGDGAL